MMVLFFLNCALNIHYHFFFGSQLGYSKLKKNYGWPQATNYVLLTIYNQRLQGACNRSPGSKLPSITTQLHCGGHLGGSVTARHNFGRGPSNDYSIKVWFLCEFPLGSYVKLSTAVQPSWSEGGTTRYKFGSAVSEEKI